MKEDVKSTDKGYIARVLDDAGKVLVEGLPWLDYDSAVEDSYALLRHEERVENK